MRKIALSFDIECYYQIVGKDFLGVRVAPTNEALDNTIWILDTLRKHGVRATMFFLGNIADAFPNLVKKAAEDGHEIGVHGDNHEFVNKLTPIGFKEEILSAIRKIKAAGANKVIGHRAPAFSIDRSSLWALDILKEIGLSYDSSIMPIAGRRYGIPDWPREVRLVSQGIYEVPLSAIKLFGRQLPCMGGGYVRYFPLSVTKFCAAQLHQDGLVPVCYFHPYEFEEQKPTMEKLPEFDLAGPKIKALKRMNFMQSIGRGISMRKKLLYLIENYEPVAVGDLARPIGVN